MEEIWRSVIGYEGLYEVSSFGNVRGIRRSGCTGNNLMAHVDKGGYENVCLTKCCKSKFFKVHRLVAQAFIPNPENKKTVNHIDGKKRNNHLENLEWMTHGENHRHAYSIGLKKVTEAQRAAARKTGLRTCELNRRKTPVIMRRNGSEVYFKFESAHEAARVIGGDASPIIACCRHRKKTYKNATWRYANVD